MRGEAVVTADEMKRLEKSAFDAGESELKYMGEAGKNIAKAVEAFLLAPTKGKTVSLLIGKGNNGGDAFVAGQILLEKGFHVVAHCLFAKEECSPLSQKMASRFEGTVLPIGATVVFEEGIILDGLVGTGFKGAAEGDLARIIEAANDAKLPIFAIDIPSGLNGNTGRVESVAIRAHTTLYLGLPKIGFFLEQGWRHVGRLQAVSFGMPEHFLRRAQSSAYLLSKQKAKESLPPIDRDRHKYEAGYILAVAGSPSMPGAAIMACFAALKSGAGIIRLFHQEGMREELSSAPYELIREEWDLKDPTRILEEAKRAKALILGPGMGRTRAAHIAIKTLLEKSLIPTVVDADALYFLAEDKEMPLPKTALLTPHQGEMAKLLGEKPNLENCKRFAQSRNVTLILKGAPTFIFHPDEETPLIIPNGDPGMATAGTGDVLTGVLAALLAQGCSAFVAAALGVYLHALSGEIAAENETSYGVVATDLIHYLPEAFEKILSSC